MSQSTPPQRRKRGEAKPKVRYFTPPNTLRQKVGTGGFRKALIAEAQALIDSGMMDFGPHAEELLQSFERALDAAIRRDIAGRDVIQTIITPIVDLKGTGAMFGYGLVSDIAAVALDFLELLDEINDDAVEIITVHHEALQVIIRNRLAGDGGIQGHELVEELSRACERYCQRHRLLVEF